jgi:hypothetical protein
LQVEPGQRLVVLNSTWNPSSLFGDTDDVLPLLLDGLSELPVDEYRVAAVLHPNVWYGHGPGQIRAWLRRAQRAGMLLIPPLDGWRQTLAAADLLIGDHGSVTYYASAVGIPVLLGAFPADELDPASPVAEFGRIADRLDLQRPLRPQLDAAMCTHRPERFTEMTAWASSEPGRAAALHRELFYRALGIAQPSFPAQLDALAPPQVAFCPPSCALRVLVSDEPAGAHGDAGPRRLRVTRYPEYADPSERSRAGHVHVAVREDSPDVEALRRADLILAYSSTVQPTGESFSVLESLAHEHPHASMVANCTLAGNAIARYRDGRLFMLQCTTCACDAAPFVSVLLSCLDSATWTLTGADSVSVVIGRSFRTARIAFRAA